MQENPRHLHSHLPFLPLTQATQAKSKESGSQRTETVQTFVQTLTDITRNVNRFGEPYHKLDNADVWTKRRTTDNKDLAVILDGVFT